MPTRRRAAAARDRARDAAAKALLDELGRQGDRPVTPTARVRQFLAALDQAGVGLTAVRPSTPQHWPSQPSLDSDTAAALERLAAALADLAGEVECQEQAVAAGPGTSEAVMGARLADPVPVRLDARGDLRDRGRFGDVAELKRLQDLRRDVLHHIDSEAAWLTHETWPHRRVGTG